MYYSEKNGFNEWVNNIKLEGDFSIVDKDFLDPRVVGDLYKN